MKTVPVEPTDEQMAAAQRELLCGTSPDEQVRLRNALRAVLAAAPSQWVKVSERVPEEDESVCVLFCDARGNRWIDTACSWSETNFDGAPAILWMPLPTAPAEGE